MKKLTNIDYINDTIKKIQDGENDLLKPFIKENMELIYSKTKKYYGVFEDYDDLVQEAVIAFINAVYSYDYRPYFLKQYAAIRIHNAVTNYVFSNLSRIIDEEKRYEIVKKICDRAKTKLGREINYKDIVIYNGLEVSHAQEVINIYNNKRIYIDIDESKDIIYLDYSLDDVERIVDSELLGKKIKNTDFFKLTQKQKDIILERYGFVDGEFYSINQLAKSIGITKQGIHNYEKIAKEKILQRIKR